MRLIDIDKVVSDYKGKNKSLQNVTWFELTDYEVKAIPIEWFKKKIDWHFDNVIYGAEVYQWVLNRWYEDKENWEKENEVNRCR